MPYMGISYIFYGYRVGHLLGLLVEAMNQIVVGLLVIDGLRLKPSDGCQMAMYGGQVAIYGGQVTLYGYT